MLLLARALQDQAVLVANASSVHGVGYSLLGKARLLSCTAFGDIPVLFRRLLRCPIFRVIVCIC